MTVDTIGQYWGNFLSNPTIVSLVPSWTEFLFDCGVGNNILGRTKYCIYPSNQVQNVPVVGGTKNPDTNKIIEINPDLVIGNKEENKLSDINLLRYHNLPVIVTAAERVIEALEEMIWIEKLVHSSNEISCDISQQVLSFSSDLNFTYLYLIWKDPYMAVTDRTYIGDVISYVGGHNVISFEKDRYPKITTEKINKLNPDFIFLPNEPYEFSAQDKEELLNDVNSTILLVDGTMASWYGKRLIEGLRYYRELIT